MASDSTNSSERRRSWSNGSNKVQAAIPENRVSPPWFVSPWGRARCCKAGRRFREFCGLPDTAGPPGVEVRQKYAKAIFNGHYMLAVMVDLMSKDFTKSPLSCLTDGPSFNGLGERQDTCSMRIS